MNCSKETVLDALTDFANQKPAEIPSVLDEYLAHIAKTGRHIKLRPLLCRKLELVMNEFHKTSPTDDLPALPNVEVFKFDEMKEKVLEAVNNFTSAPFTIQRLCELVVDPRKHYKRTDKFMRGVEKNVLVVSTIEPKSLAQQANAAATPMVNGIPGAEDGAINGHFADTAEEPLGRLDGENGHCEDEGICADDPGTNGDAPAVSAATVEATTSSASSGDAPQPVKEEVAEETETKAVAAAGSAEQLKSESSPPEESGEAKEVANGEAKEEASGEASEEVSGKASGEASEEAKAAKEPHAEVEKETPQEVSEAAAPSAEEAPPAESAAESLPTASTEGKPTVASAEPAEVASPEEEKKKKAAVCDKDTPEAAAEVPSEADSEDAVVSEAKPEVAPEDCNDVDDAEKQPSQSAPDLSEADAVPPPVAADESNKPADPPATSEGPASDFTHCDSSVSAEAPCEDDDDLGEPPLKKFHAEPKEEVSPRTEKPAAEEPEQPSSTSVLVEENLGKKGEEGAVVRSGAMPFFNHGFLNGVQPVCELSLTTTCLVGGVRRGGRMLLRNITAGHPT
ncbi:hypothetical protein HPB48_006977 [Haemaphysalis longicornis]|uniref:Serine/threonine protein phosphatase 4 regulatory subunit n=1 Tax=Haemaphysalis longicornis TaxID=44386 RepID=A0A9J6FM98_HAELO|nr:hypothetical protein HPB48_006977 [Haemaphysalis longicornis]